MGASKVLGILLMIAGLGMVGLQVSGKVQGAAPLYGAAGSMFLAIILLLISAAGSSDEEEEVADADAETDEPAEPADPVAPVIVLENGQRVKNIDSDDACKEECEGHAACLRHTYAKNKAGSMACKLYTEEEVTDTDADADADADTDDESADYTDEEEEEEEDKYIKKSGHILAGTKRSYMGEGNLQIDGIDAVNVEECKAACKSLDEDGDGCHGFEYESGKGGKDITCQPFHLKGKKELIENKGMHTYILRSKVKDSDAE